VQALKGFLDRAMEDHRMGPLHVSLYVVLLDICERQERPGLFAICRQEVMARSRILGRTTYYKYIGELAEWGYIVYQPENYPGKRCRISFTHLK
jgi:hypothetical protein